MSKESHRRRRQRLQTARRTPVGASPGTLTADPTAPRPEIVLTGYGPDGCREERIGAVGEIHTLLRQYPRTWITVSGLGSAETIRELGDAFSIHPLAQEDILNVYQRPKVEAYGQALFIVLRLFRLRGNLVESEQLSLYLDGSVLLSFQESMEDRLEPVRARLRQGGGRLRERGLDYLAYALLDAAIDGIFPVLENCGERLEILEEEILNRPGAQTIRHVHEIKRELLLLRRAAWPTREAINLLLRDPLPMIQEETRPFLRDSYDHMVQVIDLIETYRELGADLTDVYLSSLSQRTNEVMRLLTVIATIFIPLSFFAGVWGMNFDPSSPWNMPELHWRYGYPAALGLMTLMAAGMLVYFRRRGWLGKLPEPPQETSQESERPCVRSAGAPKDPDDLLQP